MLALGGAPAMSAEKVLHSFQDVSDGAQPYGSLIQDEAGNLYGTTSGGGNGAGCPESSNSCGIVFEVAADGTETVLHAFAGGCDGGGPLAGLLADKAGNLYGTTSGGGDCKDDSGFGTVFRLAPDGTETVLYAFKGGKDGFGPLGNLAMDKKGNLYGTTEFGGNLTECNDNGCGIVFAVEPSGKKKTLHVFQGGSDGEGPLAGLIMDKTGNLYGTTDAGGGGPNCDAGCGTVFKIAPDGTESVLYSFQGGSDGELPRSGLIADGAGNLYGTTEAGGSQTLGTVFKVAPDGTESVLYSFQSDATGILPLAGLILDKGGNLYGTTGYGGSSCKAKTDTCGVVYKLAPDGTETVLYAFDKLTKGQFPAAALLMGKTNILYGTAVNGGNTNSGVVFSVTTN
jgi:uncharacterized repeat protein (TIGR03803 family)